MARGGEAQERGRGGSLHGGREPFLRDLARDPKRQAAAEREGDLVGQDSPRLPAKILKDPCKVPERELPRARERGRTSPGVGPAVPREPTTAL